MLEYKTVYSKRKSVGIYVLSDGSVEVRCPRNTDKTFIESFVESKAQWIMQNSHRRRAEFESKNNFKLNFGDMLTLLGKDFELTSVKGKNCGFDGSRFYAPENLSCEQIKECVVGIYKSVAKDILTKKIAYYSELMNASVSAVKINGAKRRWGSCSGRNSINFSWKLITAPEDAVDYVVVHELAHTFEHNHSDRFWAIVRRFMPDFEVRKKQLVQVQKKLALENWD